MSTMVSFKALQPGACADFMNNMAVCPNVSRTKLVVLNVCNSAQLLIKSPEDYFVHGHSSWLPGNLCRLTRRLMTVIKGAIKRDGHVRSGIFGQEG